MRRLKLFLALTGFSLAAAGMALDHRPLVWVAMSLLAVALGIRLWMNRNPRE
jgi:hypothetical protein